MVCVVLLTIVSHMGIPAAQAQVNVGDSLALVQIYDATNGAGWTSSTNWLTGPVNTWQGVTVTGTRVTALSLTFNNLSGALPYHLGFLQELTELSLQGNSLTGSVPATLVFLQKLKILDLSLNKLSGSIPATLGLTLSLTNVNLSGNLLGGSIPVTLALLSKLKSLDLSSNKIGGSIPAALGTLAKLQSLNLSNNKIGGPIPTTFSGLNSAYEVFLFNNKLSGPIPDAIGGMDSLQLFNASHNKLSGAVPASVATLPFLYFFNVESNEIKDLPNLSGSTSLLQLYVANNKLTFGDIVPNITKVRGGNYAPQDSLSTNKSVTVCAGATLTLSGNYIDPTPGNTYIWFKTDLSYRSPSSGDPALTIPNVTAANAGVYSVRVANSAASRLQLYRRTVRVNVKTCGTGAQTLTTGDTKVYPVPFNDATTVEVAGEAAQVVVMDSNGTIVETHATEPEQSIEIGRGLKKGTYLVQSSHGGKKEVVRVIKN